MICVSSWQGNYGHRGNKGERKGKNIENNILLLNNIIFCFNVSMKLYKNHYQPPYFPKKKMAWENENIFDNYKGKIHSERFFKNL